MRQFSLRAPGQWTAPALHERKWISIPEKLSYANVFWTHLRAQKTRLI